MLIAETHLGLVVGRGRLDDDGGLGRLGSNLGLGDEGLAGESGGGEGSHLVERLVVVCCWVQEWSKRKLQSDFFSVSHSTTQSLLRSYWLEPSDADFRFTQCANSREMCKRKNVF